MMFYYFHWGEEISVNKEVIMKFKFYYKLSFSDIIERNKYIQFDASNIPIKEVIWNFCILPDNIRWNIKCMFPDHKDSTASFRIYENTNSFCCFWCGRKWNAINFISEILWISKKEAYKKLFYLFNKKNYAKFS
jgi:hypothetical protein